MGAMSKPANEGTSKHAIRRRQTIVSTLFLSPHNDDETLFGAFTIMKEKPIVCVVFDSYVQVARGNAGATASRRRNETLRALGEFGYSLLPSNLPGSAMMPELHTASMRCSRTSKS